MKVGNIASVANFKMDLGSPVVARNCNIITMVASYSTALSGFVDKRTRYIACIVSLFGSMSTSITCGFARH